MNLGKQDNGILVVSACGQHLGLGRWLVSLGCSMGSYSPQQIGKTIVEPLRMELLSGALTKIDVEQGRVGTFHQDLLGGTMQGLIHEVDTISNHGSDPLSKALREPCNQVRLQSPWELGS